MKEVTAPRYYSLDVFRGATVALMILVNNPGSWGHIYPPLQHAPWHGCTPTDLVFPFFLFAVGNAMAFVIPRMQEKGPSFFWQKVLKRAALIFLIGLFLNWSPFIKWVDNELVPKTWDTIRLLGVLQRIAIAYLLASIIVYYGKARGAFITGAIILLLYWFFCWWLGAGIDPYSLQGYFGTAIDRTILGEAHMYKGEGVPFDPEGLASSLPAVVQVIFGFLTGQYIREKGKSAEMLSNLFVAGLVLTLAGLVWDLSFPINKKIWTSSYALYTSGIAISTIGIMIHLLEFRNAAGKWSRFFDVFGKNPLFIFVLSGFLPRLLALARWQNGVSPEGKATFTSPLPWLYQEFCKPVAAFINQDERLASLFYALIMISFYWLIVYILDRKKIYIRV